MGRHHRHRVVRMPLPRPRFYTFRLWWRAVRKEGIRVFVRHPHHYVVALGLSGTLYVLGHYGQGEHLAAWLYAVLENISTVLDE